jgi:hypothetical protein
VLESGVPGAICLDCIFLISIFFLILIPHRVRHGDYDYDYD